MSRPNSHPTPGALALAVVVFFATLATVTGVIWRLEEFRRREDRAQLEIQVRLQGHESEDEFDRAVSASSTLAAMIHRESGTIPDFDNIARRILLNHPGAVALALEHHGVVQQMKGPEGTEMAVALALLAAMDHSKESGFIPKVAGPTFVGPFELSKGRLVGVAEVPVMMARPDGSPLVWGRALALIDMAKALDTNQLFTLTEKGTNYELWRIQPDTGRKQVIAASSDSGLSEPVQHELNMPNGIWILSAAPVRGWDDPFGIWLKAAFGLLFSSLLASMVKLMVELRVHRKNLEFLVSEQTAELRVRKAELTLAQAIAHVGSWMVEFKHTASSPARQVSLSAEAYRIHGFPEGPPPVIEDILKQTHPDDRAAAAQTWSAALSGKPAEVEIRIVREGKIRWVQIRAEPEFAPDGTLVRLHGTTADITERRNAEEAMRESEERFRSVVEGANIAAFLSLDMKFAYLNPAALRLFGAEKPEQLLGQPVLSRIHPSCHESIQKRAAKVIQGQKGVAPSQAEIYLRLDGTEVPVEATASPIFYQGQPAAVVFVQDVTERRQAEAALREKEQDYRILFESMLDAFAVHEIVCDAEGRPVDYRFLAVNPAFERLTGLHAANVVGQTVSDLMPAVESGWGQRYGRVALSGEPEHFEDYSAGLNRYLEVIAFRPKPGQLATVFSDITDRRRSAESLRQSEEKFFRLFQHAPVITFLSAYDEEAGSFLDVNKAFLDTFLFSRDQVLGRTAVELGLMTAAEHSRLLQVLRSQGEIAAEELVLHASGGREIRCLFNTEIVVIGGQRRLLSTALDISVLRAHEEALQQSESKMRSIFHATPVGIGMFVNRVLMEANDYLCTLTGYSREELLGKSARILYPTQAEFLRVGLDIYHKEGLGSLETQLFRKDGKIIDVRMGFSLLNPADPLQGKIVSVMDITERKSADQRLRLVNGALEAAANAIVITSRDGMIEWANPAFTEGSGYSTAEAIGRTPGQLLKSGQHEPAFYQGMWTTIVAGKVWRGEITNRRKDGSLFTEDITITPMKTETGVITHFLAVKQDITRRKVLEAQLLQAQKMEAIGLLTGGIAHDFNNILAAVLMYLGLLEDEHALDRGTLVSLKDLEKEVRRGATLTRQLLMFSRQEAMTPALLDLNTLVDGLTKMLRRLLGENIKISYQRHKTALCVEADAGMLEQVVINLCINARDAMPHGGQLLLSTEAIVITAETASTNSEARPGRFVRLTVSDTGCGMDDATLQRIFEPFFTTKAVGKGTGLGLATVHGIVKQHNGWIVVKSVLGQGTSFRVYLPECEIPLPIGAKGEVRPNVSPGQGETILVVEDENSLRNMVCMALRRHGYIVVEAVSGTEGLVRWREQGDKIDLLLTDMIMPGGMDGYELAAQIHQYRPNLNVIVCTGYTQTADLTRLEADPRFALLRKPFDIPVLMAKIRQSLSRS